MAPARERRRGAGALLLALIAALALCAPAGASDPSLIFTPKPVAGPPGQLPPPPIPPPNGYFNGPCGLAIDSGGRIYVADGYHDAVDVFAPGFAYVTQISRADAERGPCVVAVDGSGDLYLGEFHGGVQKWSPSAYPPEGNTDYASGGEVDPGPATGLAVDSATGDLYVNKRTHVSVYDSSGAHQLDIGAGELGEGYGVAVSAYGPTAGFVYVPDAAANEVKVFDAVGVAQAPIAPPGGFTALRDSSVAVDRLAGYVYVVDNLQPADAERPQALVHVFSFAGAYLGHLKYKVIHGEPSGLAVDNSATATQGRVYVTSGNTHEGAVYVYPPHAATGATALAPQFPPPPLGGDLLFPTTTIGAPAPPPGGIACEGDACQSLPPEPLDPTLTTLLQGLGNPKVRYRRYARKCGRGAKKARRKRCRRGAGRRARASALASASAAATVGPRTLRAAALSPTAPGADAAGASGAGPEAQALLPGTAGFDAVVLADGGESATLAGSHPYSLKLAVGLDQGGGDADLRELAIELPAGLLANPAATGLCAAPDFATPRVSPFDPGTTSGESCPARSQVGTVEVTTGQGGGETRRFGLFNLDATTGTAMQLGAAPFGLPLVFDATLRAGGQEAFGLTLTASEVPAALEARALEISIWGVPWDATHNAQRGSCLNESEPAFDWSKCSVGEPLTNRPLAFLTLPTECGAPLAFAVRVVSWAGGQAGAETLSRDSGGDPALLEGCESLPAFKSFDLTAEGLLSVGKASSSTGFVFRLANEDSGLANPRARIRSHPQRAVVRLPRGVTLNPSLGAGLRGCAPAQLAAETAFNPPGAGCPNDSKIGEFRVRVPFYDGFLRGSVYLAEPRDNPFGALFAIYLVAKSADRGLLIRLPGELAPDPGDGTITATFEDLPQLPYADLEIDFRSGQRAPLVSPPRCGAASTQIVLTPSSGGASAEFDTDSQITSGVDFGPCPGGSAPPFNPEAVSGGVNSNVGSYTPYYIRLSRKDSEQEITSYSLVLPKGITGKLAGIPFCPEAAIAAARVRPGMAETASPSCPAASQVGRTDTGYGVGSALTYAPGRIYLAGPHGGQPLSLVTINSATVGPFDLGTIVIRSAFAVDERTAQLQIDSSASDPIPHIIDGVPLHLRDIRIYMDRFQFTHNPTSCEPSQLISTLTGSGASFATPADDSTATVSRHFQLLNCLTLGFRPRLGLRLRGSARRAGYPSLRASFASRGARDSNLKRIGVEMPHSLFLAQNHIRAVCAREQFAAQSCPAGSVYGRAVAHTPLFDDPLRGNVYLRSSSSKLPDLVADLRSGQIRIVVEGRIGPGRHGGIRTFFDNLPDAPIDRFTMILRGGRRGLLQNSSNICANPPLATVSALGQNNIGARFSSELRGRCKR
jgi:hypothetical protein